MDEGSLGREVGTSSCPLRLKNWEGSGLVVLIVVWKRLSSRPVVRTRPGFGGCSTV